MSKAQRSQPPSSTAQRPGIRVPASTDPDIQDYAATEKISDLPRRLSTEGAPPGIDPSVGDITYYAPWGNLALFYRDFGYSTGLIKLGKIDSGVEALARPGPLRVTIELVEK